MKPKIIIEIKKGMIYCVNATCDMEIVDINWDIGGVVSDKLYPDNITQDLQALYSDEPEIQEELKSREI